MAKDKAFSIEAPYHDVSTYFGRFQSFLELVNPTLLLHTSEDLEYAQNLLKKFQDDDLDRHVVSNAALWEARQVKESMVHPQTESVIPLPFRMAAFVPVNIPICAGMLLSAPTTVNTIFWQWANQSYNAGFNYANRNASSEQGSEDIMKAYGAATAVSCISAVGLDKFVTLNKLMSDATKQLARRFVPFFAVASAGSFNALLMRYNELQEGIDVMDQTGKSYGKSQLAAKKSMAEVVITRIALPVPILLLPPYIMQGLKSVGVMPTNRYGKVATELGIITSCLLGAFPAAIALFPQQGNIQASSLEPAFQKIEGPGGRIIDNFFYNKGV